MKGPAIQIPSLGSTSSTWTVGWWLTRLRHVLARLSRASTWRGFSPHRHPHRMIAASVVLYVGLGIIIAITVWNHWKVAHP
jgi:hypothetical protein